MKKSLFYGSVVVAALTTASVSHAATQSAGTLTQSPTPITFTPVRGAIDDVINFTVSGLSNAYSNAVAFTLNFLPGFTISSLNVELFGGFDKATNLPGASQNALQNLSFSNLSAGNYSLHFTGLTGASGGGYTAVLAAAPVPEPSEWAMMAAGLGIVGLIARRRRQTTV